MLFVVISIKFFLINIHKFTAVEVLFKYFLIPSVNFLNLAT